MWQANEVASRLADTGGPRCRIVIIKTSGDQLADAPLSEAGGKRLFVKEIEEAAEGKRASERPSAGSRRPELVERRVEPFSRSKNRGPR